VPTFKTFIFQNQDMLKLWYEDVHEPLEDRISFAMRCLKYLAHICILFIILVAFLNSDDQYYDEVCSRR